MLKRFGLILLLVMLSGPALAQEYAKATWPDLLRGMLRFNALSMGDLALLNEYAIITECKLYDSFYSDDFKWNKVLNAVRDSVRQNIGSFPTGFYYDTELQLDRYDFQQKIYRFTPKTTVTNVNTFVIYSVQGPVCDKAQIKNLPVSFRAVLDTPLYMDGIPLAPADAENLLKQMNASNNESHVVYVRFNMRIIFIDQWLKNVQLQGSSREAVYQQANAGETGAVRMDARMDSIDIFSDPERTKLIYKVTP